MVEDIFHNLELKIVRGSRIDDKDVLCQDSRVGILVGRYISHNAIIVRGVVICLQRLMFQPSIAAD